MNNGKTWRETTQHLMPLHPTQTPPGHYDIYPSFPIGDGKMQQGYDALAAELASRSKVVIDGYVGVFWDQLREELESTLSARGIQTHWINVAQAFKPRDQIEDLVTPFLGGDDPLFGTRFTGKLNDFFDPVRLADRPQHLKAAWTARRRSSWEPCGPP